MKYINNRQKPDFKLALLVIALALFGIIMLASASSVIAYEKFKGANDYFYVTKQAMSFILGFVAMAVFASFDYRKLKKLSVPLMAITLFLLIAVFLPVIGVESKGAHRWVNLGFGFQPSELTKVTFLIYLCSWFDSRVKNVASIKESFLPFLVMLGLISALIILQPDLGTLSVIILTSMVVFFASGAPIWNFISLGGFLGLLFVVFIRSSAYRWKRFLTYMNPSAEALGRSYHVNQAFIAVSQGGFWGLGFGNSIQKLKYLPEPHTDSIFAIICEELGFLRSSLVIAAFFYLFFLGLKISKSAPDTFGRLLAVGITSSLTIQALINIAAMLGLVPLTGVTLPFISYGGTSLVISFIQVGILLNISKQRVYE